MADTWGITTFYNPVGWKNKRTNYQVFRRHFALPLLTIEISANGRFELRAKDAEILLQFTAETMIWQKEAAINVGVRHLPPECVTVVWTDADVIWEAIDWTLQLDNALQSAHLVQPFAECVRLPRGATVSHYKVRRRLSRGSGEGQCQLGFAAWLSRIGSARGRRQFDGHVGFAWAARKKLLESVGLYPYNVLGGGDGVMASASIGMNVPRNMSYHGSRECNVEGWRRNWFAHVQGRLGFLGGRVYHLWHGKRSHRAYFSRHHKLAGLNFNPARDVSRDPNGLLQWTNDKMRRLATRHFQSRREEGG